LIERKTGVCSFILPNSHITHPFSFSPFLPRKGFLFTLLFSCHSDSRDYVLWGTQTLVFRCKFLFIVAIENCPFVRSCLLLMSLIVAEGDWLVILNTPNSLPLQHTHLSFAKRRWDKEFSELQSG